ncbi:hypothetical protein Tco_0869234, partial [Tanacetum coccineum]
MESNNMKSSCLDKDEQEIQRLCEIKKEMQKKFDNIFHNFQICIHGLRPNWFYQSGEYTFQFLFGEKFQSFKNIFDNNIDQLKKQLDKEELHECDSKTCLAVLKKQFDTFFDLKSSLSSSYQYQSELARQKEIFQEYAHYTYQSLKETILAYLNAIDKMIDERACHEEELRITEKDIKNKQKKLEMEKQETMIQKSEYSSPGDNSDAKREKQEKKENCSKTFQELKMVVLVINPRQLFAKESEFAFEVLFGEDYDSFAYKFYHNLARLENQLSRVENHEGDSKTYLIELRKYCLNAIEKEIDARAHHEDKLARVYDSRVNERTTQIQEGMVYMVKDKCDDGLVVKARRGTESEMKDECSNSGNDTQDEGPDIRLSNDTKLLHEVQSTIAYNEDANDRQHAEQPKFINEGKVDQDAEQCLENKTTRVHKENLRATLSEFSVNHICGKEDSSPSSTNEL